ncbi:MAG TPA: ATP-binding protein [Flavobacteriales bacterium]|nr:ATP-binding protein [Flavobacteriales bacterium]
MFPIAEPARSSNKERRLLRLLYAVTLAVLALFLWATFRTFDRYTSANKSVRDSNAVLHELESMTSALKDAQIGVQGYVLTHDTSFLEPFRWAQPAVEASIGQLDSLERAGATDLDLAPIKELSRQLLKMIQDQFLSERHSGPGLQGMEQARLERSREVMDRIRHEHVGLAAAIGEARNRHLTTERSLQPDTPLMLLLFAVLAILATGLLFWRLFGALSKAERAEEEIQRKVDDLNKEVRTREFAERSLKRVLDSSPSAILAFRSVRDDMGRVVDFECILSNHESDRLYGREGGFLVGHRLLDSFPWMQGSTLHEAYLDVVDSGEPYETTMPSLVVDGVWVHVHALRLLDGFVVTITDVSETRRAQQLLAESDRLAITGSIARTIAHEVRNPLTNLNMALEQLVDELDPATREDASLYTDILKRNMDRIGRLITDLLESSKPKDLDLQTCGVRGLLEAAVASVQDRLDLLGMRAEVEVSADVQDVMADPAALGVALTNLCVNAIEAMREGEGLLQLTGEMDRGRVLIRVRDNGKGIAQEEVPRLFQTFYSGRSGGMGLGLTSARTILSAHGVHVDVESQVGKGTAFILTFPG